MDTQNTPVHAGLWHRDFWLLALASLSLTAAMYLPLPLLPAWMMQVCGCTPLEAAVCVGVPGVGIFMFGCFCSYLVQRYRRNHVCIYSLFVVAVCFYCLQFIHRGVGTALGAFGLVAVVRLAQGALFGLAQMVLSSTLIIDTCESFRRTEANYSAAWFTRLALSFGPMLALVLLPVMDFGSVMVVGAMLCILAVILISAVKFPFKAPEDIVRHVSADRFFLPQGKWLFVNFLLVTAAVGLVFSINGTAYFYGMLSVGFVLSLLAARFVFANAELKSEAVTGIALMIAALLVMLADDDGTASSLVPVLMGCGMGVVGSRFLLFFIKLSPHCRRGTSQSTYFLACESGLSVGLFLGYGFFYGASHDAVVLSLVLCSIALAMYVVFTHRWYVKHKNR